MISVQGKTFATPRSSIMKIYCLYAVLKVIIYKSRGHQGHQGYIRDTCFYFMKNHKQDYIHFYPVLTSDVKILKTKI